MSTRKQGKVVASMILVQTHGTKRTMSLVACPRVTLSQGREIQIIPLPAQCGLLYASLQEEKGRSCQD
ncbi:hypothetical protein EMIT051CA3_90013 [Pseudomonas chlororaphis]